MCTVRHRPSRVERRRKRKKSIFPHLLIWKKSLDYSGEKGVGGTRGIHLGVQYTEREKEKEEGKWHFSDDGFSKSLAVYFF